MARVPTAQIIRRAWKLGTVVPGFNIPYLPMMEPVVQALVDMRCIGLVMVSRLEWIKFKAGSIAAVRDEYENVKHERYTRLHLDHVPVIDEDGHHVDYLADIRKAIELGYESVMVDGSRLDVEENIAATCQVVQIARAAGVPVEAELGAILGHEAEPMPPYEELFATRRGFTDPQEAKRFVETTEIDWLSMAVGNVHGATSEAKKSQQKIQARLDIEHMDRITSGINVPLVLHGGTGIEPKLVRQAVQHGIAKINIGTAIRQPYEQTSSRPAAAQREVYAATVRILRDDLRIEGSADLIDPVSTHT